MELNEIAQMNII